MNISSNMRKRVGRTGKVSYQITLELGTDPTTGKRMRKFVTVNGSKKEAERVQRKLLEEAEQDLCITESNVLLKDWIAKWLEVFGTHLEETTRLGYKNSIETYINPLLGNIRLDRLQTIQIQQWVNGLQKKSPVTEKGLSAKTIINHFKILKGCLDKAVQLKMMKGNPCNSVQLPKKARFQSSIYDEAEVQALVKAIRGTDLEIPLLLEIHTGIRRGELLALQFNHIDFEKCQIHIRDNIVNGENGSIKKDPKTAAGRRTIDISQSLAQALKKHQIAYMAQKLLLGGSFVDSNLVVHQSNGKGYQPDSFSRKWRRFCDMNSLRRIRLHDLRHTSASLLLNKGVNIKVIQERLGHSSVTTTLGVYGHVLPSASREAANLVDNIIDSAKNEVLAQAAALKA